MRRGVPGTVKAQGEGLSVYTVPGHRLVLATSLLITALYFL